MSDSEEPDDAEQLRIPADILELLEERRRRVESGEDELLKWDDVRDSIGEVRRRSKELEDDPSLGVSWEEIKRALGR